MLLSNYCELISGYVNHNNYTAGCTIITVALRIIMVALNLAEVL